MATMTIHDLPKETLRAIEARAKLHGRSPEAEVRSILDAAVAADSTTGFGTRIAELASEVGGFDLDIERTTSVRK